jgi:ribosome-associated protein
MENEAEFDEIEPASKSQLKRDSHNIQNLGKRLTALSTDQLARMPVDEAILEAIALAHKIHNKRSALKRHYQFLGKLLRARDTQAIFTALQAIDQESQHSIQRHHRAEHWRDQIIDKGIDAINALVDEIDLIDRKKLRQLWRNHENAKTDAKKIQHSRLIYKEIKRALDSS